MAKRLPPPVLPPADDGAYRFVAFNEPPDRRQSPYWGGHVAAYLKATGEKIWDKYLYRVWREPGAEPDAQDVYLKKMYLDSPNLLVLENEQDTWFVLERHTGEALKVGRFKRREDDPTVYYTDGNRVEPIINPDYYIEADSDVTYGHQKLRAYDLPTGKLLWEKKVQVPRDSGGARSRISFIVLNDEGQLEITFDDGSESKLDMKSGHAMKMAAGQ